MSDTAGRITRSATPPADRRRVVAGEHAGKYALPTTWVRGRQREYVLYVDASHPFPCNRVFLSERDLEPEQQQAEAAP